MLAWTVDAAMRSDLFSDVVVSTDDDQIANIAAQCGAQILRRGDDLSNDAATLIQVVHDVLRRWDKPTQELCLLPANCPLRVTEDIKVCHARFIVAKAPAVLSVCSYGWTPPFRAQSMRDGRLEPLFARWADNKSQEYPAAVCPSGAVYWGNPSALVAASTLYVPGIEGVLIPWHRAIDIDTQEDLELALCVRFALDRGFKFGG
jgi:N-acylneuraminate cytidylyltransferase